MARDAKNKTMGAVQQINEDLKQAQKSRNELVVSTLRVLRAEFMNAAISKMKKELTDEEAVAVIRTQVKKLKEAAGEFERGGRPELAQNNQKEIDVLSKYLPAQMGEAEIKKEIEAVVLEKGYKKEDFGKAMGEAMAKVKGKADGGVVSRLLKEILENNKG